MPLQHVYSAIADLLTPARVLGLVERTLRHITSFDGEGPHIIERYEGYHRGHSGRPVGSLHVNTVSLQAVKRVCLH